MQSLSRVVMAVVLGVAGLVEAQTGSPPVSEPELKMVRLMIMAKQLPCQQVDEGTLIEKRGDQATYRISCDGKQHVYRFVTTTSGDVRVEPWR